MHPSDNKPMNGPSRRRAIAPLFFALLVAPQLLEPARARAATPDYELGVFAGAQLIHPELGLGRTFHDPTQTLRGQLKHSAAFGLRLGLGLHPRFTLEGELAMVPTKTVDYPMSLMSETSGQAQVTAFGYRLHGLVHFLTGRVRPYLTIGGGGISSTSSDVLFSVPETTYSVDGGLGLKVDVRPLWGLRLEGKVILSPGAPDAPPLVPNGEVTLGIYTRFGVKKAAPPALPPDEDADKDGLNNAADQCPEQAGIAPNKGCPAAPGDADGDGIADAADKCPLAAEVKNEWQDEDGCPDEAPPAALRGVIGPMAGVSFAPEKAELLPASYPALDRAVQALLASPEAKIEIAAVTPGPELAQQRADAVKSYLVNKGVHPSRLSTKVSAGDKDLIELRIAPPQ
jgi:outer membrane protein OmpA-like peptidoglycan-associated protein